MIENMKNILAKGPVPGEETGAEEETIGGRKSQKHARSRKQGRSRKHARSRKQGRSKKQRKTRK
jgi:hypothetical protein